MVPVCQQLTQPSPPAISLGSESSLRQEPRFNGRGDGQVARGFCRIDNRVREPIGHGDRWGDVEVFGAPDPGFGFGFGFGCLTLNRPETPGGC